MTGTIKRLVSDRGFGFLRGEDGAEFFFHRSAVEGGSFDELNEGDSIEFEVEAGAPKGPRARTVRRPQPAAAAHDARPRVETSS